MFSVLTNMVIMYVDIVLLIILLCLILCVCTYCVVRIRRLQQSGQVTILLRPTRVMFSHKNENSGIEERRTVVAYQNPFTGDYCVNKSRPPKGYLNALASSDSPDSGVSDEYEPLKPVGVAGREGDYGPFNIQKHGTLQSVGGERRAFQSTGDVTRAFQTMDDETRAFQTMRDETRAFQTMRDETMAFQTIGDKTRAFESMSDESRAFQRSDGRYKSVQSVEYGHRAFHCGDEYRTQSTGVVNSVNKTWNWNYKEYQI